MSTKIFKVVRALFVLGLLQGALEAGTAQAQTSGQAFEFIDVHSHLVGGRSLQSDYYGAMSEAINIMDRFGIRKAFILPPPQITSQDWYDFPAIIGALNHHPQRFAFLGSGGALNVRIHRSSDPDLRRGFSKCRFSTVPSARRESATGLPERVVHRGNGTWQLLYGTQ